MNIMNHNREVMTSLGHEVTINNEHEVMTKHEQVTLGGRVKHQTFFAPCTRMLLLGDRRLRGGKQISLNLCTRYHLSLLMFLRH